MTAQADAYHHLTYAMCNIYGCFQQRLARRLKVVRLDWVLNVELLQIPGFLYEWSLPLANHVE